MKTTSKTSFIVGIIIWVAIFGAIASFMLPTSNLVIPLNIGVSVIISAIVAALASYMGARRYFLPDTAARIAWWVAGINLLFSIVSFSLTISLLGGLSNVAQTLGSPILAPTSFIINVSTAIVSSILIWGSVYFILKETGTNKI